LLATRNHAGLLDRLLNALLSIRHPRTWEIIVADNGSVDGTPGVARNYATLLPIVYLRVAEQGKSRALNEALKQARGDIILFTDDDIIPAANWLVNHVRVMKEHPEAGILGGRITVDETVMPAWVADSYNLKGILFTGHDLGDRECIYPPGLYPYGPNISVRKNRLSGKKNPWPVHMGPGTRLPVGDEMVFVTNVSKTLQERLYSPDCVVEHRPVLQRYFFVKSLRRCFQGGYAAGCYARESIGTGPVRPAAALKQGLLRISGGSVREICCIISRAAGYLAGLAHRRLDQWLD